MNSGIMFILAMVIILAVYTAYRLKKSGLSPIEYFKTHTGLGILKGVLIAVVVMGVAVFLGGCSGNYLNDASAYAGIEATKDVSPQCENTGIDPHGTSNLGFKLNLYQSDDGRFRTNAKYTHHSCALSPDRNTYDAVGMELEYKIWQR